MRGTRLLLVLAIGMLLGAAVPADKLPPPADKLPPVDDTPLKPLLPPPPPQPPPPPGFPLPPEVPDKPPVMPKPATDEEMVERAGVKTDADALLAFFRHRTLSEAERVHLATLIRGLGALEYDERAEAANELIERGPAALELLRATLRDSDLEVSRRAEKCIHQIVQADVPNGAVAAAVRVLAKRNPPGAVASMLAFAPHADNDVVTDEIRLLLRKAAVKDGKAHPLLVAALTDRSAARRAAAGEALARADLAADKAAVRELLDDPDALVRFRVAQAATLNRRSDAVPVLIDTLPDLPLNVAWQAEDFLLRVAGDQTPPSASMGNEPATRRACRDAWQSWWKTHGTKIDLTRLEETPKLLGNTLIVQLDQGKVLELGPTQQVRWQVNNLQFPLDAQLIGEDRLLVAEYYGNRVSERDIKTGRIVWQHEVTGPLVAQRLANGNTFVSTDTELLEFDKDGKEVLHTEVPGVNRRIMKALKLPGGEIACLTTDSRVLRLDAKGKELHGFSVSLGMRLFGGRLHMMPNGRVLVPHNSEDKVVEYDGQGKPVWEVSVEKPILAWRLPNGNTLVTSMAPEIGAVEFDRTGTEVWSYHVPNTRVTRAIRR